HLGEACKHQGAHVRVVEREAPGELHYDRAVPRERGPDFTADEVSLSDRLRPRAGHRTAAERTVSPISCARVGEHLAIAAELEAEITLGTDIPFRDWLAIAHTFNDGLNRGRA